MWILRTAAPDDETPLTFRLLPGHVRTIGRAAAAHFVVEAPLVSRVHCRVWVEDDGRVMVADLDSTNGTWINGQQITTAELPKGGVLRVGRVELVLEPE